ncbi:unnamed protein product [Ophioblennius macclurei]
MADFPATVNTHTGGQYDNVQPRHGGGAANANMVDTAFIRSIPAVLMMAEMLLGLLHWSLIASVPILLSPFGWVLFVAVTTWILTIVLFLIILFGVHKRATSIPWALMVMVYHIVATVLYLTAFAVNAAYVDAYIPLIYLNHMAAAAFFGSMTTLAYGVSTFFSFMDWKANTGTPNTNVPT